MTYEERYVAFADILGFESLVKRTIGAEPSIQLSDVLSALVIPDEVRLDGIILGRVGDITVASHTLTTFSDCLAISTEANEKGLMNLLFHLRAIAFRLLKLGFFIRGGITKGSLYHKNGRVVGPAMIEAYKLEHDKAKFPRIIIDPSIAQPALDYEPPLDTIFKRLTRKDEDGYYFVHYLWAIRMVAESDDGFQGEWAKMVNNITVFVQSEKERLAQEPDDLVKVLWFEKYFDWSRDRSHIDFVNSPFPP